MKFISESITSKNLFYLRIPAIRFACMILSFSSVQLHYCRYSGLMSIYYTNTVKNTDKIVYLEVWMDYIF